MGSGPSSNSVKSITLETGKDVGKRDTKTGKQSKKKGKQNGVLQTENEQQSNIQTATPSPPPKDGATTELAELTRQLCESESQRLDLEDKVQSLEESLEYLNNQNLLKEEKPCDETLHAKDHYIDKLEKEKNDLQTSVNKMRQKHRRKLKQFNSQMAEYKQETNFQIMEMNEEIKKLKQDNRKLLETNGKAGGPITSVYDDNDTPKLPGGDKMKLILELSEQVTEQEDKISKLQKMLKEKDQTIDELRVKLKNNTEYLKALDERQETQRSGTGDRNNSSINRPTGKRVIGPQSVKNVVSVKPVNAEVEDDFDDYSNMNKLSSYLQGVQAKKEVGRISIDSIDEQRGAGRSKGVSIVEEGVGSGTGRDSGLGSAGKREEEKTNTAVKSNNLDWNSFESGLSDSDIDGNIFIQSKISSAPPKLQNGKNQKLKKKTSSLKKRYSHRLEDKPPKPGLAFINSAVSEKEETDNLWDGYPLSPIISPVDVC